MTPNIKLIVVTACILLGQTANGQKRLSLDSVVNAVRENNPMLKSYGARADAMNAYARGAKGWMAPEVGGGLWMIPYKTVDDPRDQGQFMLSVQQKIQSPGKLRANEGYLASKAGIEQANEMYVFNELRAEARTAYYQWMVLEKKKAVLKKSEEIIGLVVKIATLRYPYNQGKLSNVYKAEGRLQEIRNMMLMNDNLIVQKNIQLNRLMNVPNDVRYAIDTTSRLNQFLLEIPDTTILAERRSDVHGIEKRIESMRLNQEVENAQGKPDFNLSFNHMIARGAGMPNQFMLIGMVSIPIAPWSSKMYKSNSQGMGKEIEAMKNERAAILNEAAGMTASMVSEITTLDKQMENYETRILPALRKNYETLMLAYEENKEELPIVIDAWETLNMTQLQYLDTVQRYYEMVVSYEKLVEK